MLENISGINNISGIANSVLNSLSAAEGTQGVQSANKLSSMLSDNDVNLNGDAFKDILNNLLNSEQINGISTDELMSGDINNLVTAMVDMAESDLTLQFTMQVRNKIIDAYKEIMSMQI